MRGSALEVEIHQSVLNEDISRETGFNGLSVDGMPLMERRTSRTSFDDKGKGELIGRETAGHHKGIEEEGLVGGGV